MTEGELSTAAILGTLVPMGVIIIGLITATIINGIKLRKERRESEGFVPDEPLGASIKKFFRRKRRESLAKDESSLQLTDRSYDRFGPGSESTNTIENQLSIAISQTDTDKKINLEQYIVHLVLEDKSCSICKLVLEDNDTIVQCPNCKSLFHYEHIEYWFEKNHKCPVCGYRFL